MVKNVIKKQIRNLIVILGDQLDKSSNVFLDADPNTDIIWMAEVKEESKHVVSAKQRIAIFLSAMRHFCKELRSEGWTVEYTEIDDPLNRGSLILELERTLEQYYPEKIVLVLPGEWRILESFKQFTIRNKLDLEILNDSHFITTVDDFINYAKGRKQLRMEYWYRELRRKHNVLMEGDKPIGDEWNYDKENRKSFGKSGPIELPAILRFKPDAITLDVITLVNNIFKEHLGKVEDFDWPLTRSEALASLDDFITNRLPLFGDYEDALWINQPWLYHSQLSCCLNLKLLNPREVITAAEKAYKAGKVPLASAEGFIRQILGWREYVRGIYWMQMPAYKNFNYLNADKALPPFFWTGETSMACLSESISQTLKHGYAHHIQRLMVIGLYSLLYGVKPTYIHEWFLSVYLDAVEWVELPNVLGMSQYADGGLMASKPYVASGKYIQRMSNYCDKCKFNPSEAVGITACPFTTLYWDFLIRHQDLLKKNTRMIMQLKNLDRLDSGKKEQIVLEANKHRLSVTN